MKPFYFVQKSKMLQLFLLHSYALDISYVNIQYIKFIVKRLLKQNQL